MVDALRSSLFSDPEHQYGAIIVAAQDDAAPCPVKNVPQQMRLSKQLITRIVPEVCTAIIEELENFIKFRHPVGEIELSAALCSNYKLVANPVHNEYQLPLMYRQTTDHFRRQTDRLAFAATYTRSDFNQRMRSFVVRSLRNLLRLRWAGHVACMGESRNAYRVLVGRSDGKRPLGRPRRRWEDNIKMDLREVGYDDRDWINPSQDRDQWRAYVRAAMNHRLLRSSPCFSLDCDSILLIHQQSALLYDDLLQQRLPEGCTLHAYADDALKLAKSSTFRHLEDIANEALAAVHMWGKTNKLNFNASKTSAMLTTRKRNIEPISISMDNISIVLVDELNKHQQYKTRPKIPQFLTHLRVEEPANPLKAGHPSLYIPCLKEICDADSHHCLIYTDKSRLDKLSNKNAKVGCAFVAYRNDSKHTSAIFKLSSECSVFQAELLALRDAIKWCSQSGYSACVHSDSQSAVISINDKYNTYIIASEIRTLIMKSVVHICITWVRGHTGIVGNERADELAKMAANSDVPLSYNLCPLSYIKKVAKEHYMQEWNERWVNSDKGILTKELYFPTVYDRNKCKVITPNFVLTQFLTGMENSGNT
ncbi:hypothetical protein ANN_09841 [Periplaneta americana]|uniref:ribonuclease H n=1 Tax=Periplaneta americana TaxID=6978 RepID=A0ABQ8TNF2_PERAM|nr:hypothetical protein ANN_09841 [Periplaneta americana]